MKQLMDYIVAALVLLLCWPVLLYIAIRIRMQGTGNNHIVFMVISVEFFNRMKRTSVLERK